MRGTRALVRMVVAAAVMAGVVTLPVMAQASCEVNNQASCTVGGDATHAITITVHTVVRLATPSTTITLPTQPGGTTTGTFFGTVLGVPFLVRSNTSYALAVSSSQAIWSSSGPQARSDKPRGDLQFSGNSGSGFQDMSATPTQFYTGVAESDAAQRMLYLQVRYNWALDTPGSYSLPISVVITAP